MEAINEHLRIDELLTQETTDFAATNEEGNLPTLVTPEKARGNRNEPKEAMKMTETKTEGKAKDGDFNTPGKNRKTQSKLGSVAGKSNPYGTLQSKKREVVTQSEDAKKPAGKKLKIEACQTTETIFCKFCMTEHKKHNLERFYKCNQSDCGRLIKDNFRDEDERLHGTDVKEDAFDNLEKHFHAIEYNFVYDKGPNKENTFGLFKMREKAIAAGILPKDFYMDTYGNNHAMTSAVRAVAKSLEKRDATKFRFAFHALMYLIMIGNYTKFDRPIRR